MKNHPARRRKRQWGLLVSLAAFTAVTTLLLTRYQLYPIQASISGADLSKTLRSFPVVEPTQRFGFALDTFQVQEGVVESGDVIGDILQDCSMRYPDIQQLVNNADSVFNVSDFRIDKPYTILSRDTAQGADYLVYEPNVYEYIVFDLKKELSAHRFERPVEKRVRSAGGSIESSLWAAMDKNGIHPEVIVQMENALQWAVDFYHLQKDDEFQLIYDQHLIEGEQVGAGFVHTAYYKTGDNEHFAIYYEHPENPGYYDLKGRPMKKGFLKSPVKYSRISSYYNLNRYHPILKRRRPHLGTDYAAPYGTPIYAVGDGVVIAAAYTNGNGNYVKIKHSDAYTTQYLHMSKFAQGISSGVQVRQGQTIGYVGSTGLATGPHVCFRFWKNGRQVNHLRMSFPPPEPLPDEDLPDFIVKRDSMLQQLGFDPAAAVARLDAVEANSQGNP